MRLAADAASSRPRRERARPARGPDRARARARSRARSAPPRATRRGAGPSGNGPCTLTRRPGDGSSLSSGSAGDPPRDQRDVERRDQVARDLRPHHQTLIAGHCGYDHRHSCDAERPPSLATNPTRRSARTSRRGQDLGDRCAPCPNAVTSSCRPRQNSQRSSIRSCAGFVYENTSWVGIPCRAIQSPVASCHPLARVCAHQIGVQQIRTSSGSAHPSVLQPSSRTTPRTTRELLRHGGKLAVRFDPGKEASASRESSGGIGGMGADRVTRSRRSGGWSRARRLWPTRSGQVLHGHLG